MPVIGGFPRAYRRATEKCDEFAPSHCPQKLGHHIVSTFIRTPEGSMSALAQSGHVRCKPNVCLWAKSRQVQRTCRSILFLLQHTHLRSGNGPPFYLLLLGQLCAFAHLLRLVTWHHLFWCGGLHLC